MIEKKSVECTYYTTKHYETIRVDRQPRTQININAGYTIRELRVNAILIYLLL